MKKLKKHDAMYAAYGYDSNHLCRDCCNFTIVGAGARRVSKCRAYGVTASSATDWNGYRAACGMFGKEFCGGESIMKSPKYQAKFTDMPCGEQIELEVEEI